jgi:uncharacterized membrane protein (UPF0182 family)
VTFNVPRPQLPEFPKLSRRAKVGIAVVGALIVLFIVGNVYVKQYTDLLWFRSVGYSSVFSRRLVTELLLFFVFGAVMALAVAANVIVAFRLKPPFRPVSPEQENLERYRRVLQPVRGWVLGAIVLLIGVITGASASRRWETWLLWRNGQSFGIKDPQFHKDVSYFSFTYPMQRFVLGTLFAIVVVSLLAVLVTSYLYGSLRLQTPGPKWTPASRVHVSILLGLFVLLKAVAYYLDRFGLAFSGRGIVTGPSYTDVHAVLPAKTILVFVAIICALLFFANSFTRNWTLPAVAFGLMALSAIVIGGAYPALVQHYKVKPSAQDLESPYIQRNIDQTKAAYGLNDLSVDARYPGVVPAGTSAKTVRNASTTAAQIRVLDPNVVSQTFEQLQQQRSYYTFPTTLDVDRYDVTGDGKLTDVVVGARDINLSGLQSGQSNWINQHLVYTHGFGLVAAQADTASDKGSPAFLESDLPPKGKLNITEPRIYFGDSSPAFSIVGTEPGAKPRELDRPADSPSGQVNRTYTGGGGVSIGSFWRQAMYAWKYRDKNFLLSSGVNSQSRLLYVRDPRARVQKVAPWLTLDGDSYPVVVDGQIDWVVDGYTTTSGFPYSEQESLGSSTRTSLTSRSSAAQKDNSINYIRNSVKATVNAYTGQVTLYEWNQVPSTANPDAAPDPVLKTWEKAFPGVVKPQSDMPQNLVPHLRYPEDLFNIQRTLIARYHVTDPKTFYGGAEFWNVPNDPTVDGTVAQPAYYFSMTPDGSANAKPVYSLTSSLVSLNRRNLTAYLSVNSQPGPGYGKFELLELPSDQATPGPQQVQNAIESTTAVSTQLSLLRQGGSRVTLGNLLSIPLDGGFLYVEPIYVQSAGTGSFPELREIAAVYGGTVAYQPTLAAALDQAFGVGASAPSGGGKPTKPGKPTGGQAQVTLAQAIAAAQRAEADAQAALRRGDFAAYGAAQRRLQRALNRIAAAASKVPKASTVTTPKSTAPKSTAPTPSSLPSSTSTATPVPTTSGTSPP